MQRKLYMASLKRRSVRQVFAWSMAPEPKTKPTSKLDKEYAKAARDTFGKYRKRRFAVGFARAYLGPHFFAGCYVGAEHD